MYTYHCYSLSSFTIKKLGVYTQHVSFFPYAKNVHRPNDPPPQHLRVAPCLEINMVANKMDTASDWKISRELCCYFGMFQYGGHQRVYGLNSKSRRHRGSLLFSSRIKCLRCKNGSFIH